MPDASNKANDEKKHVTIHNCFFKKKTHTQKKPYQLKENRKNKSVTSYYWNRNQSKFKPRLKKCQNLNPWLAWTTVPMPTLKPLNTTALCMTLLTFTICTFVHFRKLAINEWLLHINPPKQFVSSSDPYHVYLHETNVSLYFNIKLCVMN